MIDLNKYRAKPGPLTNDEIDDNWDALKAAVEVLESNVPVQQPTGFKLKQDITLAFNEADELVVGAGAIIDLSDNSEHTFTSRTYGPFVLPADPFYKVASVTISYDQTGAFIQLVGPSGEQEHPKRLQIPPGFLWVKDIILTSTGGIIGDVTSEATPQTLTDGATVTMDMELGYNGILTFGSVIANRTLNITNLADGENGAIHLTNADGQTITFPEGYTNYVSGTTGAVTSYTFPDAASAYKADLYFRRVGNILLWSNNLFLDEATAVDPDVISLEFYFDKSAPLTYSRTISAAQAGTYTTAGEINVASYTFNRSGTVVTLPFTIEAGHVLEVTITRSASDTNSILTINTNG